MVDNRYYYEVFQGSSGFVFALIVLLFLALIGVIGACCFNQKEIKIRVEQAKEKLKETFATFTAQLKQQPGVFVYTPLSVPGNCRPYSGCASGYTLANPISLKTGKRVPEPVYRWCEKSWRDCNAYQTCIDGLCV
jgi:hypothetical protein